MLRKLARHILAIMIFTALCIPVSAGEAIVEPDGSAVWKTGVDGVEIEFNQDGSVKRISSRYSTPVEFADRRGIRKAQIIAEEKAKETLK